MAALASSLSSVSNFLTKTANFTVSGFQQIRSKYKGRWMKRDKRRRKLAEENAPMRLRLVALKRNNVLPPEIHELAQKQIDECIPRQSHLRQLTNRCVLTSRPRGVVIRWRLSRIVFRSLADYNKLAGVQRAIW